MTNLLAAVAIWLTTNTSEVVTAWSEREVPCQIDGCSLRHIKSEAEAKTVTTRIEQVTKLAVSWKGDWYPLLITNVLSNTSVNWERSLPWAPVSTNRIMPYNPHFYTTNILQMLPDFLSATNK